MSEYAKGKSLAWQLGSCEFRFFSLAASERKPGKHQPSKLSQDLCCIRTHAESEVRDASVCPPLLFLCSLHCPTHHCDPQADLKVT